MAQRRVVVHIFFNRQAEPSELPDFEREGEQHPRLQVMRRVVEDPQNYQDRVRYHVTRFPSTVVTDENGGFVIGFPGVPPAVEALTSRLSELGYRDFAESAMETVGA